MKLKIFIITFLFILLVGVYTFAEGEILDSNIPDSWYEAPKTASEMGINKFDQSPTLDTAVEEGELPPVEERLPEDPPVIEPYEKVGEYGGVINVWSTSLGLGNDAEFAGNMPAIAGRPAPDGTKTLPYFLKDWEFSDDYTEITIYLRKGIKFSDGTPLTADDYLYWWEHEANNEDLEPVPPEDWKPAALLDVEKIDNHTVKYSYEKPYPKIDDFEFKYNMGPGVSGEIVSANYMKQFHPNFVEEQKIVEMAKDVDLDNWDEYYSRIRDDSPEHPEYERQRPVLRPYIAVERSETRLVLERNPYYPFVDTEGNQLPYVDEIVVNLANDDEMARTKAVTGEATFASRFLMPENIPLYKQNEEKENYSTLLYRRAYGSDIPIQLNLTHKNDNLREIFQNKKFRQALSIAIDRENINNKIYFGEAEPTQTTVLPTSKFYKEEYAKAYTDYDPEKAKKWLDEIGMEDVDGDGFRELPNGDKFNPTILFCKMGPVDPTTVFELVNSDFEEIGLDFRLNKVSRELHDTRRTANEFDVSAWPAGMMLDVAFGSSLGRYFAPIDTPFGSPWPGWVNWYETDGEEGMEPPEQIKELINWGEKIHSPVEKERMEAGKKLTESHAENLWTIGTIRMAPQPTIISNTLKNVPKKGFWGWDITNMRPMYPVQFYLEK